MSGSTIARRFGAGKRSREDSGESAVQDVSGYIQLRKMKRAFGRTLSTQKYINRMVQSNMVSVIHRFQNMSATGAANGKYFLANYESTHLYVPIYVFELNSLRRNYNPGYASNPLYYRPFQQLRLNSTSAAWDWVGNNLYGCKPDGSTGATWDFQTWQNERDAYAGLNSNDPYESAMMDWAEIQVNMWGATNDPSTVEVSIVRFTDEDVCPPASGFNGAGTGVTWRPTPVNTAGPPVVSDPMRFEKYNKFWSMMADNTNGAQFRKNTYTGVGRCMKTMYRKVFNFNPTSTYETDTAGHQVAHKIFYRINERTSFVSPDTDANGSGTFVTLPNILDYAGMKNINAWPEEVTAKNQVPYAANDKARLFLMIRAFNSAAPPAAPTATVHPSFDLMVRRKYTIIS